ncbi:hypothetical protein CLF_108570 [Clonorchis sinensis]|uniref:Uncharacterized protein n=1 Tax=Clonorchis sinensis TaxID=79923 RepID=G7YRR8_CLOSI|nr:hypothetical protein CLF_108570 [Clonorchis sinensis]
MHTGASHVPVVTERRRPGLSLVDNPPYKQTSSAMITWNSELVTGLGIGLLIVILLCLLLLVTYALHGTKLMPNRLRRPAGSTHGFRLGKMPIRPGKLSDTSTDKAKRISFRNNQGKLHGIHKALGSVFNPKSSHNQSANEDNASVYVQDSASRTESVTASVHPTTILHPTYIRGGSPDSVDYIKRGSPKESTQWLVRTLPRDGLVSPGSTYVYASNFLVDKNRLVNECSVCNDTRAKVPLNAHYTALSDNIPSEGYCKQKRLDGYQTLEPDAIVLSMHSPHDSPNGNNPQPTKPAKSPRVTFYDQGESEDVLLTTNSSPQNTSFLSQHSVVPLQHPHSQSLHTNTEAVKVNQIKIANPLQTANLVLLEEKNPKVVIHCQKPENQSSFV